MVPKIHRASTCTRLINMVSLPPRNIFQVCAPASQLNFRIDIWNLAHLSAKTWNSVRYGTQ